MHQKKRARLCQARFCFCRWAKARLRWARCALPTLRSTFAKASVRDQRAAALVERTEGFVAGDGGDQLVEVPFVLGLGRLLHLEQIHVVDHATVDADLAPICKEVFSE